MDYAKESLRLHGEWKGKIEVTARVPVETKDDLSLAYTPGVAQPCLEIQKDINKSYELTRRWNLCAVITDGSAVLGLGDIGPEAGMPVMEGKCVLFKAFGDVDAFPLCVRTHDVDEFVNTVALISGSFGGVNLEDISAPRCFEIERRLKERCDIPIFHDDQHGTAVITLAGLTNALKVVGKKKEAVRIVTSGAGAAAIAIVKLLLSAGFKNVTMCDRKGAIYKGRDGLNWIKEEMAEVTNLEHKAGSLADILVGADVFIGVSAPGTVTTEMVKTMNRDAIVFACANPTPEIFPEDAKAGGAKVISTGRSDYPNQINNVLAFPGIFRGAFDVRAGDINEEMKVAAAHALAELISDEELSADYIIPKAFDHRVGRGVDVFQQMRRLRPWLVVQTLRGLRLPLVFLLVPLVRIPYAPFVEGQGDVFGAVVGFSRLIGRVRDGGDELGHVFGRGQEVLHGGGGPGFMAAVEVVGMAGDEVEILVSLGEHGLLPRAEGRHIGTRGTAGHEFETGLGELHGVGHLIHRAGIFFRAHVAVDILELVERGFQPPGAHVDGKHDFGAGFLAPAVEVVDAHLVGFGAMPGQVAAHGAILAWTDAVFPVVVGYEIAAGVAHAGDAQLLDQVKHVLAEAVFVGGGMAGLVDAAVDAAAQMFYE